MTYLHLYSRPVQTLIKSYYFLDSFAAVFGMTRDATFKRGALRHIPKTAAKETTYSCMRS